MKKIVRKWGMKYAAKRLATGMGCVAALMLVGLTAGSLPSYAESLEAFGTAQDEVNIEVLTACSMEAYENMHSATMMANTYNDQIGNDSIFKIYCNDLDGYAVYAIGNSEGEEGNNKLVGDEDDIETGLATSGDKSGWAFKLKSNSEGLAIQPGFGEFSLIPNQWTLVAKRASGTVGIDDKDSFNATYAAYISGVQRVGTYTGQVKYAMFHPSMNHPAKKIEDITYMQEFKKLDSIDMESVLESMEQDKQYELTDKRDGKTYYIAKLADGNVWMTENLDFDIQSGKQLTPDDTDIQTNWTPGTATTTGTTWDTSSAGYNKNMSYDPGDKCWTGKIDSSGGAVTNTTYATACSQHDKSHYHIGNYYSWPAAVAMINASSHTSNLDDVDQSICPAGWRLSKYDGTGSFNDLKNKTSFTSGTSGTIHKDPYYFVYGGVWNGSSSLVGAYGYYWSSVVINSSASSDLAFNYNGLLNLQSDNTRYYGRSVRCVARSYAENNPKTINDIKYMQEFKTMGDRDKTNVLNSMQQDKQYEMKDKRDEKTYYVAKLADGNVWMTENLDFDLSNNKQLTPDDTDIKANWTPSASTHTTPDTTWDRSDYNTPQSSDPGNKCWTGKIDSNNHTLSDSAYAIACPQHDKSHYHIGNYYSWSAAVAMSNTSSYTVDKTDVDQSICPAGWRLPKYDGAGSFKGLQDATSFTAGPTGTSHKDPYYFVYGGSWGGSSSQVGSYQVGLVSRYWSSVVVSNTNAYFLYFNYDGRLNPNSSNDRFDGRTLRCVAR